VGNRSEKMCSDACIVSVHQLIAPESLLTSRGIFLPVFCFDLIFNFCIGIDKHIELLYSIEGSLTYRYGGVINACRHMHVWILLEHNLGPRPISTMKVELCMKLKLRFELDLNKRSLLFFKMTDRRWVEISVEMFADTSVSALPPIGSTFCLPLYLNENKDYRPEFKVVQIETRLNGDASSKVYTGMPGIPFQKLGHADFVCKHVICIEPIHGIADLLRRKLTSKDAHTKKFLLTKAPRWGVCDEDVEPLFRDLISFDQLVLPFRTWIYRGEAQQEAFKTLNHWHQSLRK
jgi:hypothetical protein